MLIFNKISQLAKVCRNRAQQCNLREGMTIEANINEVDHLVMKFWK
jgi:hypothetical protein